MDGSLGFSVKEREQEGSKYSLEIKELKAGGAAVTAG